MSTIDTISTSHIVDEIRNERRRQVEQEGWTPEHDDKHIHGQMALAAASYAIKAADTWPVQASVRVSFGGNSQHAGQFVLATMMWPWAERLWKPKGARADLVRAAALIVAEIERIDRAAAKVQP